MSNALLDDKSSLVEVADAETVMIEQIPALVPNLSILVGATQMTSAQVVTQLTGHRATIQALAAAKVRVSDLVAQQKAERVAVRATVEVMKAWVVVNLGIASSVYSALGFAPAKRAVASAATKAMAVVKAQATRLKRHIMGKNQRDEIPPATVPEPAPAPVASTPNVTR